MVRCQRLTLNSGRNDCLQLIARSRKVIALVLGALDRQTSGRRPIASAQTGRSLDRDVFACERLKFSQHFAGTGQMTRQIAANS